MEKIKQNPIVKKIGFNRLVLICVMILMYLMFGAVCAMMGRASFFTIKRIFNALNYAYFLGFLALGVTFVIATGGIDFSMGPVMFCSALVSGYCLTQYGVPLALCIVISILVGAVFGMLNGYLVAYWKMPSFITSMASMMLAKGLGSVFTKTQSVSWPQITDPVNGWYRKLVKITVGGATIPTGLIIFTVIAIICAILLNNTKAGRYITCLGSNKEAVRLSGVDVRKWEALAYVICSMLAGVAAIFYVGSYSVVQPGLGDTFNNEAIASCVMGGTSMAGGIASIGGTFIGVMIVALLQEGIRAVGLQIDYQYVVTGAIVLVAVYADIRSRKRRN